MMYKDFKKSDEKFLSQELRTSVSSGTADNYTSFENNF